ncbi:tyrosine-type recombinase/integrase [Bacillus mycoides]|uniref:tyrosine-type recombinase/integrase n=1 Tax=Bacillus mycoides TaxID=1405 RepID=UPI000B4B2AD4|nr:site-specific integrase [Bacillus mycoides]
MNLELEMCNDKILNIQGIINVLEDECMKGKTIKQIKTLGHFSTLSHKLLQIFKELDYQLYRYVMNSSSFKLKKAIGQVVVQELSQEFTYFVEQMCKCHYELGKEISIKGIYASIRGLHSFTSGPVIELYELAYHNFYNKIRKELIQALLGFNKEAIRHIWSKLRKTIFFELLLPENEVPLINYLKQCGYEIIEFGYTITWQKLWLHSFQADMTDENHIIRPSGGIVSEIRPFKKYGDPILTVVSELREEQLNNMDNNVLNTKDDVWKLVEKNIEVPRIIKLNFENIPFFIKKGLKGYLHNWFEKGEKARGIQQRFWDLMRIINTMKELDNINVFSMLELDKYQVKRIFSHLQNQKKKSGDVKYKMVTINGSMTEARLFVDWLIERNKIATHYSNPFRELILPNTRIDSENIPYIPDEIVRQLQTAIKECPLHIQHAWLIMMNTGLRISEVLKLEKNCLEWDIKEKIFYLKYIPHKILRYRRKIGLDDYNKIPILDPIVVNYIKKQIDNTEFLRQKANTNYIFIRLTGTKRKLHQSAQRVIAYTRSDIEAPINRLIRRNKIKNADGELWVYSHHQCRKTLATRLLTEGASIQETSQILGHLTERTTLQYYEDIDKMKISNLDRTLFEALFDEIQPEVIKAYTKDELNALKEEILQGARETPEGHGTCLKHVSFGPCKKKSCVGCSLLLTGPQKLPMWKKLYHEQKEYIERLATYHSEQGNVNYEEYREFQAENHLLKTYENTIKKLESFIKERMKPHE